MSEARSIVKVSPTDANSTLLKIACFLGILDTHANLVSGNQFEQILDNGSAKLSIGSCHNDHDTLHSLYP
jgi:hypothetical protein